MEKQPLRQLGIEQLQKIAANPKRKSQREQKILGLLYASRLWKEAKTVGITRSNEFELTTTSLLERGVTEGKTMAIPKSLPEGQLAFYEVDLRTAYRKTKFGVEEPISNLYVTKTEIDLLIVPGVIFSNQGYRIGFGGGYYDRYLADFQGNTCSIIFSEQLRNDWQHDVYDQPVKRIYTDQLNEGASYE